METNIITFVAIVAIAVWIAAKLYRKSKRKALLGLIANVTHKISQSIEKSFLVQSCTRCGEVDMALLDVSPNARSIEYKCEHCGKKSRAKAGGPNAADVGEMFGRLDDLLDQFHDRFTENHVEENIYFSTPEVPLPYEQTTREPISESIRAEVWRRDGGKCVKCGSNSNLEFDHIIPVSKGGGTSVRNLQLLCKQCNLAKGTKI